MYIRCTSAIATLSPRPVVPTGSTERVGDTISRSIGSSKSQSHGKSSSVASIAHLSSRLPARRLAKHILCGQNVRQVTFNELVQPRPEISYCPRERGAPHGGLWGVHVAAPTTLAMGTWAYVLRMMPVRQRILKAQWNRLENEQTHPAHHIASALLSREVKLPAKSHSAGSTENRGHGH